jgi:hypothetical protein
MSNHPLELPEADGGDVMHVAMSAALSAVPFVGLGELFKFIVSPSLDKRREKWMKLMAEAVQELQNRKGVDLEVLRDNEEFITLLIHATQSALRTHVEAKRQMIKRALINAVLVESNFDEKELYLNLLDRLTSSHVDILLLIEREKQSTATVEYAQHFYETMRDRKEPIALAIEALPFLAFLGDLQQAGLIVASTGFVVMDADVDQPSFMVYEDSNMSGLPRMDVSDLARRFLRFISA